VLKIESYCVGEHQVNSLIVWCEETKEAALFDPGAEAHRLLARMDELGLRLTRVIITHGHMDHIGEVSVVIAERKVPLAIHPLDRPKLTDPEKNLSIYIGCAVISPDANEVIEEGDVIKIGNRSLKAIHVPGHSPGSLCFYGDGFLISGDALFYQGIGRSDFPDSCEQDLYFNIKSKLYTLPENTVVYPGHGPTTTIGDERENNPFIRA
jgi:hydroxyacylglutathione hydrolase